MADPRPDNTLGISWSGGTGNAWVELQEVLDGMFATLVPTLVEAAVSNGGSRVLDVGCGTGAATLAVGDRLGPDAQLTGVDISSPLLERDGQRINEAGLEARLILADAQRHPFEPDSFDVIISRFGVMFFDDPATAFANLHRAASDSADLRFLAWRGPEENPFLTTAERAASQYVEGLPMSRADAPGPFGLAGRERTEGLLRASGWTGVTVEPVDFTCRFAERDLVPYFTRIGALGRCLTDHKPADPEELIANVRLAYEPFVRGEEVTFTAACWQISATRQS